LGTWGDNSIMEQAATLSLRYYTVPPVIMSRITAEPPATGSKIPREDTTSTIEEWVTPCPVQFSGLASARFYFVFVLVTRGNSGGINF